MDFVLVIIAASTVLFLARNTLADINCPDVTIRKGSSRIIYCNISDRNVTDFYWYRGQESTSVTSPILRLDSGEKGGAEYGSEHFDIEDNGWMKITNVEVQHDSYYTFLGYYDEVNFYTDTFKVDVTISPDPTCPVIDDCNPCTNCSIFQPSTHGSLNCRVIGARPMIQLSWNIPSHAKISFVKHQSIKQRNEAMDSWNTYLSLDYELTEPCGVQVTIKCKAEDMVNVTSSSIAVLEIANERCSDAIPALDDTPTLIVVLICGIILVIIITCILIGCRISYIRRYSSTNHKGEHNVVEHLLPLLPSTGSKISRDNIVEALATFYERFCSLKPLPWGEPISITALYSEFQCVVTPINSSESIPEENQDLSKITSSDDLFSSNGFKSASRVIFIAHLGYGKTTMTQQVVQRWIKEEKANFILIYIRLKNVDINRRIASVVKDMLPGTPNAAVEDIENVLKGNKCLVLLDGLDEVSMSLEKDISARKVNSDNAFEIVKSDNDHETRHTESPCHGMKIGDILTGEIRSLASQMRVWVTSREVDDMKTPFPPPHVKVKMTGFSNKQVNAYIIKTCQYYCNLVYESKTQSLEIFVDNVAKEVRQTLDECDIIQDFLKTPLLLVLIIHILTANVTGSVTYLKELQLSKLTTLIRTVITCLESRYVQKIQGESIQAKIEEIERKLGEIAWQQQLEIATYDRAGWDKLLGIENVKIALSIGLLRLSKNIINSNVQMRQLAFTSFTGVEFYHQYFLEYLAGRYFPTEENKLKLLEKLLGKGKDEKTIRFLQFMSGSGHPSVDKVSKLFVKNQDMWNNFIDFIYESEDQEKVKSYLEDFSKKGKIGFKAPSVNFKHLDKKYHQDAVSAFCENCNKFNIKMQSFTFRQDCPLTYLTKLVIPQIKRLEIVEMTVNEKDHVSILEWVSTQKLPETIQFTKCTIKELNDESKEKIKNAIQGKNLNIYVNKEEWKTTFFPKNQ